MINIDVTLRDGGYRNNFAFDLSYVIEHAELSVDSGFDWVEIAYRNGSIATRGPLGLTGRGEGSLISAVASKVGPDHVGLILHPANIDESEIPAMHQAGARLLRVCLRQGHLDSALAVVRRAKEEGFIVCLNIVRVSERVEEEIADIAARAAVAGADSVYLADSNGSLVPEQAGRLVRACIGAGVEVGLHAHNNLGLAMSNAIAATEAGATWIDSSLLGMGKGAGNLRSEHWLAYLSRLGSRRFHLPSLFHLADLLGRRVPEAAPDLPLEDAVLAFFDLSIEMRQKVQDADLRIMMHAAKAVCTGIVG